MATMTEPTRLDRMDRRMGEADAVMAEFIKNVETRFDGIDSELHALGSRLDGVESKIDRIIEHLGIS